MVGRNIKSRKFTDTELLFYYNEGLSDVKISKIFRCKLGLVANFKSFTGKRNSEEKLLENYDIHINEIKLGNKLGGKYFDRRKRYSKNYDSTDERKKIKKEHHHRPEVMKREKNIRNSEEFKEKKSKYMGNYYKENKAKLREKSKESYQENKEERKKYSNKYYQEHKKEIKAKLRENYAIQRENKK
jgi:hypothetical protein